jgi:hypothetical protein
MSAKKLREQIFPAASAEACMNTYVRGLLDDELVGNVFATRWTFEGRKLLWIIQLCVSANHRNQGIAKNLLEVLREDGYPSGCGILSSHPFTISAVLRGFGRGVEDIDLTMTKHYGRGIMKLSPVKYVREAKVTGSLFEGTIDGQEENRIVCCADTEFWVDHSEPEEALEAMKGKGIAWPFGDLPEGHEFLVIVEVKAAFGRDNHSFTEF